MLKRLSLFLVIFLFVFCSSAFADFGDKATLGGQDSSGKYHWRVNSSGDFVPGTTAQNDIGSSSLKIADLHASGDLFFETSLQAVGMGSGEATSLPTSAANAQTPLYRMARVFITTRTLTFADGYPGQLLTLVAEPASDTGTLTITATTKLGWTSIAMDTVSDTVTLLYVDDTIGWVIAAAQGVTITTG